MKTSKTVGNISTASLFAFPIVAVVATTAKVVERHNGTLGSGIEAEEPTKADLGSVAATAARQSCDTGSGGGVSHKPVTTTGSDLTTTVAGKI